MEIQKNFERKFANLKFPKKSVKYVIDSFVISLIETNLISFSPLMPGDCYLKKVVLRWIENS